MNELTNPPPDVHALIQRARAMFIERLELAASPQERLQLYASAKDIARSVREWGDLAEQCIMERDPDLDCTIGDIRYYIGTVKKIKARDPGTTFDKLATALGGDFDAINRCLSSNAIKYGAARAELEEVGAPGVWDELFEVVVEDELKTGKPTGRAKKALQAVNTKYLKD